MEKYMKIEIKKLREGAIIPKYQTPLSACFDFHALLENDVIIPSKCQKIIPTGIAFSIPAGFEIEVRPRSGLAAKLSISITNSPGTIDADYLDEIFAIVINHGTEDFVVHNGDRIAQGEPKEVIRAKFEEVEEFSDLNKNRGGGLGSTGIK